MPQENVDRHRRIIEAYEAANVGDRDGWLALLSADVVYRPIPTFTETQECRGHDEYRRFVDGFMEAWADDFACHAETIRDYGDAVIVRLRWTGHARASGLEVSERIFSVLRFRDGQITRIDDFVDREAAIAAAEARG
jgi:ketosteroid isomerase-like protein